MLLAAATTVLLLLADYSRTWVHPEIPERFQSYALSTGVTIGWDDLRRGLDTFNCDGASRPRFISYGLQNVALKCRVWYARHFLPHPSWSPVWLITLFVLPVLLWRLVRQQGGSPAAACVATALLLSSAGYLSGLAMLFHPAKPLTLFWFALCALLAVRLPATGGYGRFAMLCLCLLASFFTDEYCLFIWPALLLLAPALRRPGRLAVMTVVLLLFLAAITWAVPPLVAACGYAPFDFWSFAIRGTAPDGSRPVESGHLLSAVRTVNVISNTHYLLAGRVLLPQVGAAPPLIPWDTAAGTAAVRAGNLPAVSPANLALYALLALALLHAVFRARHRQRLRRWLGVIAAFALFHAVVSARNLVVVIGDYYYGSLFSLLLAVFLGLLFDGLRRRRRVVLTLLLMLLGWYHFGRLNTVWFAAHYQPAVAVTRPQLTAARAALQQGNALPQLPPSASCMLAELRYAAVPPPAAGR